ncbi:MAG: LOG family protein [Puniceicoccales bacterium]|nr:LOG family protein [Puniceicoccales bacterium]
MLNTLKKIEKDIRSGFALMEREKIKHTILIWGSARISSKAKVEKELQNIAKSDDEIARKCVENNFKLAKYYEQAKELAQRLSLWGKKHFGEKERCVICSGGSEGIMEAANAGAAIAGCCSLGINIKIPQEQHVNTYVTHSLEMHYFFTRKYLFMKWALGIVVFPGGFGTLDESFEALNLLQTGNQRTKIPVIFFGKNFWQQLVNFDLLYDMSLADMRENIYFTDSVDEAFRIIAHTFSFHS